MPEWFEFYAVRYIDETAKQKCILPNLIVPTFLHSLGRKEKSGGGISMSASPPASEVNQMKADMAAAMSAIAGKAEIAEQYLDFTS